MQLLTLTMTEPVLRLTLLAGMPWNVLLPVFLFGVALGVWRVRRRG